MALTWGDWPAGVLETLRRGTGLYEPVLRLAAETAVDWTKRPLVLIAGLVGRTEQAEREAATAVDHGYHAALLNLAAMKGSRRQGLFEGIWCLDPAETLCQADAIERVMLLSPELGDDAFVAANRARWLS